jgi:hypothetical protein
VSGSLPTALAVAGTALMAVAIFGPFRKPLDAPEPLTAVEAPDAVQWPALVEATAVACDVPARMDLADALGALQSAWAESILRQALATELDPAVRSAIAQALSSSQSLVT